MSTPWTVKDEDNMRATVYQVNVRPAVAIDRPTITTEHLVLCVLGIISTVLFSVLIYLVDEWQLPIIVEDEAQTVVSQGRNEP